MKYNFVITALLFILFVPHVLFAAQVVFSVSPNTVPGDNAVILDVSLIPSEGESINAIEGRIGILGEGTESVTDVIIETGDSLFSFLPVPPHYENGEKIIRFTGGGPESVTEKGKLFSVRLFASEEKPLTVSWLGGLAYQDDGFGTAVGISSRSITFTPQSGVPNQIRSTSEDVKPPQITSIAISSDEDVFEGQSFLSIHATDDTSGISHYEVTENGDVTRFESGPYLIRNQNMEQPLHVTVYDKAGNSISVKYPEENTNLIVVWASIMSVLLIAIIAIRYSVRVRGK